MLWSDFVTAVNEHLGVDANRRGTELLRARAIKNAVIDLQRFVITYRRGHITTFAETDMTAVGKAHLGVIPDGAAPTAIYIYSTTAADLLKKRRNRLDFEDWTDRQAMINGTLGCRAYRYAINPYGNLFMIYPQISAAASMGAFMVWDGLKMNFADSETVPFPEQAAEAVALFVKVRIVRDVDKNIGLAREFERDYIIKRTALYRDGREMLDAQKRDDELSIEDVTGGIGGEGGEVLVGEGGDPLGPEAGGTTEIVTGEGGETLAPEGG